MRIRSSHLNFSRGLLVLSVVGIGLIVTALAQSSRSPNPEGIAADLQARAKQYLEFRKKVAGNSPKSTSTPSKITSAQSELANKIRIARAGAKQGEIFTPEIAAYFRRLLHPEAKEPGTKELMKEDKLGTVPFKINGPYPDKEPLGTVPPNVLASLPPLPKDIDYRFVGKHLILRDVRANMIIDYIANAIS